MSEYDYGFAMGTVFGILATIPAPAYIIYTLYKRAKNVAEYHRYMYDQCQAEADTLRERLAACRSKYIKTQLKKMRAEEYIGRMKSRIYGFKRKFNMDKFRLLSALDQIKEGCVAAVDPITSIADELLKIASYNPKKDADDSEKEVPV